MLDDPGLTAAFERMHASLRGDDVRLRSEELMSEWLRALVDRSAPARTSQPAPADARAFRAACAYLAEHADRNVGLDELAAAAGSGKFRLIRAFRARTGLPPHAMHLAHRIRRARRLIEAGEELAAVALATGFSDQSHLHRHFRRALGFTPGAYRRALQT